MRDSIWFWILLGHVLVFSVLLATSPDLYADLTAEDSWAENLTALLALATGLMLLQVARRDASRLRIGCWLIAGTAFLIVAGEEISWGQRILGLETPEQWKEINSQDETNLHNLNVRLFNNLWQAAVYALVVVTLALSAVGRTSLLGFRLPPVPIALGFVFVLVYRRHTHLLDGSMHDMADAACLLLVAGYAVQSVRKRRPAIDTAMAAMTLIGAMGVAYLNHAFVAQAAENSVSEAQEYLFLFLCFAYSVELVRQSRPGPPDIPARGVDMQPSTERLEAVV